MYVTDLKCEGCGRDFSSDLSVGSCPDCHQPLSLAYDLDRIRSAVDKQTIQTRVRGLARWREFLPAEKPFFSLGESCTPIIKSSSIFSNSSFELYYKLEFLGPTGSFKDLGSSLVITKSKEWGMTRIVDDSSGNAGASIAAYSTKAGLDCEIFVPAEAGGEKVSQIKSYGAELKRVPGPRLNAAEEARNASESSGTYYVSHNENTYFSEGVKVMAFEIAERFQWRPPAHLLVPVGGGSLLVGLYRGFKLLKKLGWIERLPSLYGVQSESCSPVVEAFNRGESQTRPVEAENTVAKGASISDPPRDREILRAISNSRGKAISVTEREIKKFHRRLPVEEGLFVEPTSVIPLAGLKQLRESGEIKSSEKVLIPLTGMGLKDLSMICNSLKV